MKTFLRYSWLNKSLALPLGCDVGPFSLFGRHYLWAPTCNVGPASPGVDCNWQRWLSRGYFFLCVFICTSKLQVFQLSVQFVRIFFLLLLFVLFTYCHLRCFGQINNGLECTASCKLSSFHSTLSREKKINKGYPPHPHTPSPRLGSIYIHDMDDHYGILTIHISFVFFLI